MRYAICFTPGPNDPLSIAAAAWLGRNVFTGEMVEQRGIPGFGLHELAFHTAVPRRYGFHGLLKAPFRLKGERSEPQLLRELLRFCSAMTPFAVERMEVARIASAYGLVPSRPSEDLRHLASALVERLDPLRAPLSEAEIERSNPDGLSAAQFANLHRWGHPYVMEEFRFHMPLTGPLLPIDMPRFELALRQIFEPLVSQPLMIANLALMMEEGEGGPYRVHSLHPMGKIGAKRSA